MIISLEEIKCQIGYDEKSFLMAVQKSFFNTGEGRKIAKKIGHEEESDRIILSSDNIEIIKKSLDARKKPNLIYVFNVRVYWDEKKPDNNTSSFIKNKLNEDKDSNTESTLNSGLNLILSKKMNMQTETIPVVVGSGPSGLFAALTLVEKGFPPIIIERGREISKRIKDVNLFWGTGILNTKSNVQFGEGGAGTFSDGKLTSGIKSSHTRKILETFVESGAPEEILYMSKPHIGTDILRKVVVNIRKYLISKGTQIFFETKLTGIKSNDGILEGIFIESADENKIDTTKYIPTQNLILATGHSARDTYKMLYKSGVKMNAKPFSMGIRVEHLQKDIDISQYGLQSDEMRKILPPSDYKLSCHLPNGRSVYSFCMCPGGEVIAGASEEGQVVTNGMSFRKRDNKNANSAILVNVTPEDFFTFGNRLDRSVAVEDYPLDGIEFQEFWEKKAYIAGGGNFYAPCEYLGSFLGDKASGTFSDTEPSYRPGVKETKTQGYLPEFITESIKQAFPVFNNKINGFASPGAVITGIESRSSSPVRIIRDEHFESNIKGIYPCGEGSGYSGGIMSSAVDGIKVADSLNLGR